MTIWEIVQLTSKDSNNFEIYNGDFLDEFYRNDDDERKGMVEQEPHSYANLSPRILPFLAGMVEKLCNDYEIDCPTWVYKDKYFLEEPNFYMDVQGNLRIILLVESPVEFKIRNIFTTKNCLTRV
jgi:hypothetical protein